MTTTVLRAVKFVGQGIEEIKESETIHTIVKQSIDAIEFTAILIGPILLPFAIMYLATAGSIQ